jgi:hypothetical protein
MYSVLALHKHDVVARTLHVDAIMHRAFVSISVGTRRTHVHVDSSCNTHQPFTPLGLMPVNDVTTLPGL